MTRRAEVTVRVPVDLLKQVKAQADASFRTYEDMITFIISQYIAASGPTPPYQTFNPIKSEPTINTFGSGSDDAKPKAVVLKKRKHKLIPDDAVQRVIMDGVRLRDPYNEKGVMVDQCKVFFYENKAGTAVLPSVMARYQDIDTGELVASITFQTPEGMATQERHPMKVLNAEELVQRWLAGDYTVVDNPTDYEPVMVKVSDGRMAYEMAPIPMGRFTPSDEQIEDYKQRGWKQHQINAFIELRSSIVPGGPGYADWLIDAYSQIDMMG